MIKQAYKQEDFDREGFDELSAEDDEDAVTPQEVGHNVFILAHQVELTFLQIPWPLWTSSEDIS